MGNDAGRDSRTQVYRTPPGMPPGAPPPPRRGWWARNWKWAVPSGCLVSVLVLGGCLLAFVISVLGLVKSSDAFKDAMARVNADPQVTSLLGTPISAATFFTGHVNISGDSGDTDFRVRVTGPDGSGILTGAATKSGGVWTFHVLSLHVDGQSAPIDLRTDSEKAAVPPAEAIEI